MSTQIFLATWLTVVTDDVYMYTGLRIQPKMNKTRVNALHKAFIYFLSDKI